MSRVPGWCTAAMLAVGLTVGCGGSGSNNKTDAGTNNSPTQICTPNQATCANATTATVCTANGLALVPVQCGTGELCTNGACVADPNAPCTSAENTCADSTHATVCGKTGLTSVTCPANTTCGSGGVCAGACIVGSSMCIGNGTVATCNDGNTYTQTACSTGLACVTTSSSATQPTAACMPAACSPGDTGCNAVCGDKTTGGTGTATNTVSTCVETPLGYQWLATTCSAPSTCNPTAGICGFGTVEAGCASQCTPGATRCSGDELGIQTCGSDGTWSTQAQCNSTTAISSICLVTASGAAVCGDIACANLGEGGSSQAGACDSDGNFHLCDAEGRVSTTVTACPVGATCTPLIPFSNGTYVAGACESACTEDAQQCLGNISYQTCTNGAWTAPVQCGTGTHCVSYDTPAGIQTTLCGTCVPGTSQCVGVDSGPAQLQTCAANGTWNPAVDCTIGSCKNPDGNDAECSADCAPGTMVCAGNEQGSTTVPGYNGTSQQAICNAKSQVPTTGTDCSTIAAGSVCRTSASGTSYGCVQCVGSVNEYGMPDTSCDSNSVVTCNSDNTTTTETECGGTTPYCEGPNNRPVPTSPPTCRTLNYYGQQIPETESGIRAFFGPQYDCENNPEDNFGAPRACGATSDCCGNSCEVPDAPTPAYCDDGNGD